MIVEMELRFCLTNGSSGSSDGVGLRMISCLSLPLLSTTVLDFLRGELMRDIRLSNTCVPGGKLV